MSFVETLHRVLMAGEFVQGFELTSQLDWLGQRDYRVSQTNQRPAKCSEEPVAVTFMLA